MQTGWEILKQVDLTEKYTDSALKMVEEYKAHQTTLMNALGGQEYEERLETWQSELANIQEGITRRELYITIPDPNWI